MFPSPHGRSDGRLGDNDPLHCPTFIIHCSKGNTQLRASRRRAVFGGLVAGRDSGVLPEERRRTYLYLKQNIVNSKIERDKHRHSPG